MGRRDSPSRKSLRADGGGGGFHKIRPYSGGDGRAINLKLIKGGMTEYADKGKEVE